MTFTYTNLTEAPYYAPGMEFIGTPPAGAWWDCSDLNSMFQDSAGTTPCAVDQPIGLIRDKSGNGNDWEQATSGSRPTLRQDAGGRYYVEFDGSNDWMRNGPSLTQPYTMMLAIRVLAFTASDFILGRTSTGLNLSQSNGTALLPSVSALAGGAQPGQFPFYGLNQDDVLTMIANGSSSSTAQGRDLLTTYNMGTGADTEAILGSRNATPTQLANFRFYGGFAIAGEASFETRQNVIEYMRARMPATDTMKNVVLFGDSITNNVNSTSTNGWTWELGTALGNDYRVINQGISSQKSDNITARIVPAFCKVSFPSNQIPASGAADVTIVDPAPRTSLGTIADGPLAHLSSQRRHAYVTAADGSYVYGEFSSVFVSGTTYTYRFTRYTAGDAIPVAAQAPLTIDGLDRIKADTIVGIWMGRNNLEEARLWTDIQAAVDYVSTLTDRWFVIHPWNSRTETTGSSAHSARVALDALIEAEYPDNHINMLEWLQDTSASGPFVALGVTPSTQDNTDIANDVPPNSWMADAVHPGDGGTSVADGMEAIQLRVSAFITDKGW